MDVVSILKWQRKNLGTGRCYTFSDERIKRYLQSSCYYSFFFFFFFLIFFSDAKRDTMLHNIFTQSSELWWKMCCSHGCNGMWIVSVYRQKRDILVCVLETKYTIYHEVLVFHQGSEWVREWVNEWMSEWVNEWMSEWVSEWVNEWVFYKEICQIHT